MKIIYSFGCICSILLINSCLLMPNVPSAYWNIVESGGSVEKKYTELGSYSVKSVEYNRNEDVFFHYIVYYPQELLTSSGKYPLIVMANGTGVPCDKYQDLFYHMASWGFIVIGNDDDSSWNGYSSSESLSFMLKLNNDLNSIFYTKVDEHNIGLTGHSQGGVAVINAVNNYENGSRYKSIFTASCPELSLANELSWPYDISKIAIPYFMCAGTESPDDNGTDGICPLFSLEANMEALGDDVIAIRARVYGASHGHMLYYPDGYMTAWFLYYLQNNSDAGNAFFGPTPEIVTVPVQQDSYHSSISLSYSIM